MAMVNEEIKPTNHDARSSRQEPGVSRDVSSDPLNSILLLIYELSIANAPYPSADCRDIAAKVAARVGEARTLLTKHKNRVLAFQEGYRDKSFEVTGLEIQLMDLRAHGADKVTARQNESLRTKLLAACIERNELRELASILITNAEMIPDPRREGATDCYAVTLDDLETLQAALSSVDGPQRNREWRR